MANEVIYQDGTELILGATGTTTSIADAAFQECTDDDRQPGDSTGFPFGWFEFDTAAGGFSASPTAGAVLNLYEQTINSDAADSPDVDANNRNKYIGSFVVDIADAQQKMRIGPLPINKSGGKYWVEWVDGGAGVASVDAGWELRLIPTTYGTA